MKRVKQTNAECRLQRQHAGLAHRETGKFPDRQADGFTQGWSVFELK